MIALFALLILLLHATFVLHLSDIMVMLQNDRTRGIFAGGGDGNASPPPSESEVSWSRSHDAAIIASTNTTRILVVFSGPTSSTSADDDKKANILSLYKRNLDYFLLHGIDCDYDNYDVTTDTVIVVGHEYYNTYLPRIRLLNDRCREATSKSGRGAGKRRGDAVLLVARRNVCYDMESARLALYGGVSGMPPISTYDYFFFVNCGVTGPAPPPPPSSGVGGRTADRWTSHFIRLLDDTVKMTGLTLNCEDGQVHIMSMMYAVDRIGLDVIMKSGAVYDCLLNNDTDFIGSYEKKMGDAILDAGYGLRPLVRHRQDAYVTKPTARQDCRPCKSDIYPDGSDESVNVTGLAPSCKERDHYGDIWIGHRYDWSRLSQCSLLDPSSLSPSFP